MFRSKSMSGPFKLICVIVAATMVSILLTFCGGATAAGTANITLNPQVTYQTIEGWEATDQAGQVDFQTTFPIYKDSLFDQLVNDLGVNRLRLEVFPVIENTTDYFAQYVSGQITSHQWESTYEKTSVDVNANPLTGQGYIFTSIDNTIDQVVLPIRQRLLARGESLWLNVEFVNFPLTNSNLPVIDYKTETSEYANFVLAVYMHLQTKYGIRPDSWDAVLEPDNAGWSGTHIGQALVASGPLLRAHGFRPHFLAPSTASMSNAHYWFDQLMTVPGAGAYLSEITYHRYSGVSLADLQALASRAQKYHLQTGMTEHGGSSYPDLYQDLTVGQNSAWQQYTIGAPWPNLPNNCGRYFWYDLSNPNRPVPVMSTCAKFLSQYFKFIRRGAVRIEAETTDKRLHPVAFINADGKYVVVVATSSGGEFSIQGLPAGTYAIQYTTQSHYKVDLPDVTLSPGQALSTSIPDVGVITVYAGKSSGSSTIIAPTGSPFAVPNPTRTALSSPKPTRVAGNLAPPTHPPASAADEARCFLPIPIALGMLWFISSRTFVARGKKLRDIDWL